MTTFNCTRTKRGFSCETAGKVARRRTKRKTTRATKPKARKAPRRTTRKRKTQKHDLEPCVSQLKGMGKKIKCFKNKSAARKYVRGSSWKYPFKVATPCRNKAGHKVYCVYGKRVQYSRYTPPHKRKRTKVGKTIYEFENLPKFLGF